MTLHVTQTTQQLVVKQAHAVHAEITVHICTYVLYVHMCFMQMFVCLDIHIHIHTYEFIHKNMYIQLYV